MADHYYSLALGGEATFRNPANITVGTSATGGNVMEFRITDGQCTPQQAYDFLEWLADLFAVKDQIVIVAATLKSG